MEEFKKTIPAEEIIDRIGKFMPYHVDDEENADENYRFLESYTMWTDEINENAKVWMGNNPMESVFGMMQNSLVHHGGNMFIDKLFELSRKNTDEHDGNCPENVDSVFEMLDRETKCTNGRKAIFINEGNALLVRMLDSGNARKTNITTSDIGDKFEFTPWTYKYHEKYIPIYVIHNKNSKNLDDFVILCNDLNYVLHYREDSFSKECVLSESTGGYKLKCIFRCNPEIPEDAHRYYLMLKTD